jgi:hypothetical protein
MDRFLRTVTMRFLESGGDREGMIS